MRSLKGFRAFIARLNTSGWPPGKTKYPGNSPTLLLLCNTSILLSIASTTAPFPSGLEVCWQRMESSEEKEGYGHMAKRFKTNQLILIQMKRTEGEWGNLSSSANRKRSLGNHDTVLELKREQKLQCITFWWNQKLFPQRA